MTNVRQVKVEENYENCSINKYEREEFRESPQEAITMHHIDIKSEIIIDTILQAPDVEKIKEEDNWETKYDANNKDPLKIDEDLVDGAIIKFEKEIRSQDEVDPGQSTCTNHVDIKSEIDIDEGIFRTTKENEGKSFAQRSVFDDHRKIHTGDKPFSCNICGKSFNRQSILRDHGRTHTGERPYSCEICGKSFIQRSSLSDHRKFHTGKKPFSCDICDKSFIQNSTLIIHKRIHTGERPYNCNICGKSFTRSNNVKRHKLCHTNGKLHVDEVSSSQHNNNAISTLNPH